jgi:hypothetical protein
VEAYIPFRVDQGMNKTPAVTFSYHPGHDDVSAFVFDVRLQDLVS